MPSYSGIYGGNWAYTLDWLPPRNADTKLRTLDHRKNYKNDMNRKMSMSCENISVSNFGSKALNRNIVHENEFNFTNEKDNRLKQCSNSDKYGTTNTGIFESDVSHSDQSGLSSTSSLNGIENEEAVNPIKSMSKTNSYLQYWSPQLVRSPRTRSQTVHGFPRSISPEYSSLHVNDEQQSQSSNNFYDLGTLASPNSVEQDRNNLNSSLLETHAGASRRSEDDVNEQLKNFHLQDIYNAEHKIDLRTSSYTNIKKAHVDSPSIFPKRERCNISVPFPTGKESKDVKNGSYETSTIDVNASHVNASVQTPLFGSPHTHHSQKAGRNNMVRFRFDSADTLITRNGSLSTVSSTSSSSDMSRDVVGILRNASTKEYQPCGISSDKMPSIGDRNNCEGEDDVFLDQTNNGVNLASYNAHLNSQNGIYSESIRKSNKTMDFKHQKQARKIISDYKQRQVLEQWMDDKLKEQGDIVTPPRRPNNERSSRTYTGIADEYAKNVESQNNGLITPPPIPPRRYRADYQENQSSLKRSRDLNSEGDLQMVSPRSPSRRKRDAVLRKYNSTSALFSSADVKSLDRHSLTHSDERTFNRYYSSSHDRDKNNNSESCDASTISISDNMYEFNIDDRNSNMDLNKVDIVGETFQARYPWQRDASTQCDSMDSPSSELYSFPFDFNRSQSDDHVIRRQQTPSVRVRPQSIGGMENIYSDDFRYMENKNGRHERLSEPLFSNNVFNRKRMPILVSDEIGSVSDLESIMENPSEGAVDNSRNNSLESAALTDEISSWLRGRITRETEVDVLASPRVSPEMWRNIPDVIVNVENQNRTRNDETEERVQSSLGKMQYLSVPQKPVRRRSSGSVTSGSDESDQEISPPIARRGRRAAIVDTKNFGDVSPTNLSPEVSPCNSCDEGETGSNIAGRIRRRRSSVELALNVYPGDLLVQEHHKKLIKRNTISDFYASRNGSTTNLHEDVKKQRQPFSLLKLMKSRSKESLTHLGDVLQKLKPSEFKDNHLAVYKNLHWSDLIASTDKQTSINDTLDITEVERKRRESVWELFKSECVFLIDHLMVLKHCFLEPLKKVQVEGFVMYAEPSEIFSNLDELCYVSYTFCKDFIAGLVKDMSITDFGRTLVLIKAFQRFSAHSKDGSVYHTYCLNYTNALTYLEKLRKNDDFCEFEKWCEQDQRCNRLQLADLLIAPMQHCTKLPLLLYNIKKYTEDPLEKKQIAESIEKVETSLQQLEDKMKWLKNFERVQEIQRHLIWPSVTDLDSRAFVPEYLKPKLTRQPCERLLACPRRQLIHEGNISLTESTKTFDAFLFLFDDILLITKIKKPNRKKQGSSDSGQPNSSPPDNQTYVVHRQPLALDRLGIHDVSPHEAAANGLKFAFVIVQISRFQQIIDVFTLQAATELLKTTWLAQIREAKGRFCNNNRNRTDSMKENEEPGPANGTFDTRRRSSGTKRIQHGKALSVDAIFL